MIKARWVITKMTNPEIFPSGFYTEKVHGSKFTQSDLKLSGGTPNAVGEIKYDAVNNTFSTGVKGENGYNFAIGFGFEGKFEASLTYDLNKK